MSVWWGVGYVRARSSFLDPVLCWGLRFLIYDPVIFLDVITWDCSCTLSVALISLFCRVEKGLLSAFAYAHRQLVTLSPASRLPPAHATARPASARRSSSREKWSKSSSRTSARGTTSPSTSCKTRVPMSMPTALPHEHQQGEGRLPEFRVVPANL